MSIEGGGGDDTLEGGLQRAEVDPATGEIVFGESSGPETSGPSGVRPDLEGLPTTMHDFGDGPEECFVLNLRGENRVVAAVEDPTAPPSLVGRVIQPAPPPLVTSSGAPLTAEPQVLTSRPGDPGFKMPEGS